MTLVIRKQLEKEPETNIAHINAFPQWFKFVVDHTDLNGGGTAATITLCSLPIKSWVHAVHWQTTTSWVGTSPATQIQVELGDEDDRDRWLANTQIWTSGGGSVAIEDAIGLIPWEPDFSNTHDLEAWFGVAGFGPDLDDITAGEITFWFLLSSMNGGSAS